MTKQTLQFQAEVAKVLDIVIHSLYSHHEIFLRELISNAADACDKLRYALLLHPDLSANVKDGFKIKLIPNKKENTLTISDNGIGMNQEDLINNLGTIARSGSAEFFSGLSGDKQKDMALIGQFGVGFYSAFMVADKVTVQTKKAGDETGWTWESDGVGEFTVSENKSVPYGTEITLHLKKDAVDYLEPARLRFLVRQYSNHISIPVVLIEGKTESVLNEANALWMRPKSEITSEQYNSFYQNISHAFDTPWLTLHYKAEGTIDYTALLYIPSKPPFNLFQPDKKTSLNLYVNRVFISDEIPDLLPPYLRFLVGVIDTKDLPLNVSREMLQKTPTLQKIRTGIINRVLGELKKKSTTAEYAEFWNSFGIVLKEGLYEPSEHRQQLTELARFSCTESADIISFEEYVSKMVDKQKNIYYLTAPNIEVARNNPQLEGFIARAIPVLLLTDPIDEFWVQTFTEYKDKKIVSVMHAKDDLTAIPLKEGVKEEPLEVSKQNELVKKAKEIFGKQVADVRFTNRLTGSPAALITPEGQMSLNLERLMKAHGQQIAFESARILELNDHHPLIKAMAEKSANSNVDLEAVFGILLDGAKIAAGEPLTDPATYINRVTNILVKSIT